MKVTIDTMEYNAVSDAATLAEVAGDLQEYKMIKLKD
jgi:hypothetical protein